MERLCAMCRQGKDESEFYFHKKTGTFNSYCRTCNRLYQKEYRRIYNERKRASEEMEL